MDDVIANAAIMREEKRGLAIYNHAAPPALMQTYTTFADKLKGVPRFLLDETAIYTSVELSLGRPKVILDALKTVRIPYPKMWVEWPEAGRNILRTKFAESAKHNITPDRPLPTRIGFLLETDETGRRGVATWAWNGGFGEDTPPSIGAVSPYFDLDATFEQPNERTEALLKGNLGDMWQDNPVQLAALFDIWKHAEHKLNTFGVQFCQRLHQLGGRHAVEARLPVMYADVYGEFIEIWSVILLLTSSRKIVDYRPVDRRKINKNRIARKQPPLLDHTEVVLHVGEQQVEGQRGMPLGYARKSPRVHMVSSFLNHRGEKHWIVRPFLRGKGETIHREVKVRG